MIRRGPRSVRKAPPGGDRGGLCWWCHKPSPGSPFRSPIRDVIGGTKGGFVVCGPQCPERPLGVTVFSIGTDWANQGEPA